MAKNSSTNDLDKYFSDLKKHYTVGFQETDRRRTGRGRVGSISFDEADELFRSWLDEKKWPYDALLFDPRTFTFIFEKTSRLLGNRLRGELVPREGSDVLKAKINNAILDYQWDQANHGGTMLSKWALLDIATRKYGSGFGLCKWRYETDKKGRVVFDGPEMQPLNNRDIAHDMSSTSMETCRWFQVREYVTIDDLKQVNDAARGKPIYQNLDRLEASGGKGDPRSNNYISRNRTISGLSTVPVGQDPVFKEIEIVTEYRRDEWFTFAPREGLVLRKIDNPYDNYEIPITMLRYYAIDDDLYGLSEIEPIKSLQKAINAILCQYVDEINMKLYTPVAIGPGVRQHTLEWGKGARWQMQNPMTDFRLVESQSAAAQYFNNTYSALVAAMMNALGQSSLGVSNIDRFQNDKTAAEVKSLVSQQNSRDNLNQMYLAESIERQMKLWHSMNQKMLFADSSKKFFILRVAGKDAMQFFQESQDLNQPGVSEMAANSAMDNQDPNFFQQLQTGKMIDTTTDTANPTEEPKFSVQNGVGKLFVEPTDLLGEYDYVADVKSMAINSGQEEIKSRDKAVTALLTNPNVGMLLAQENVKPKFKDLFVAWLEDSGFKDADRYFEQMPPQQPGMPGQPPMPPGAGGPPGAPGMPPGVGQGGPLPMPPGPRANSGPPATAPGISGTNPAIPTLPGAPTNVNTANINPRVLNRQVQGPTAPPMYGPYGGNYGAG